MLKIDKQYQYKDLADSYLAASLLGLGVSLSDARSFFYVLDDDSLAHFWKQNFGNNGAKRRIPEQWWGFQCEHLELSIKWNNYCDSEQAVRVAHELEAELDLTDDAPVYFFGGVEVVKTMWQSFAKHWSVFYDFNDEGICCSSRKQHGLRFSPLNKVLIFGDR